MGIVRQKSTLSMAGSSSNLRGSQVSGSSDLCSLISQKVFIKLFSKGQLPQKSVNVSCIITKMKNTLTDLCGNRFLPINFTNTFWEIKLGAHQHPPLPRGNPVLKWTPFMGKVRQKSKVVMGLL